jgi:hypothetical protein
LLLALAACAVGCGGGSSATLPPEPTFANTAVAERAFHRIEARFAAALPETRGELEPEVRQFLSRFPGDGRARLVRAYLAWILVDTGRAREGRLLAHEISTGPRGVVRDLAAVVEAAALRRQGQTVEALRLLLPLEGKIVDASDRSFFSAEFIQALVAVGRYDLAIRAMLDWADQAPQADREAVVSSIEGLIRGMPTPALDAGFRMLDEEERSDSGGEGSGRAEARRWLYEAIRLHLVRVALSTRDSALARRLVETSRPGLDREQTRDALASLAASSAVKPRVAGRTIGVVLDVADATSRPRSAAAVAGMTRALGLPLAADREDSIRLATRDASEPGDVERALSALAGDGAVILVAGVGEDATVAASIFAERVHVPVITLTRPSRVPERASFTFALGTNAEGEESAISAAISELGARSAARIGPGGAPCDAVASTAGGSRFPVHDWKRRGADALVLGGDTDCARDAVNEAVAAGLSPSLVLGLESAEADDLPGRKIVVTGGRFPFGAHELRADERAWVERWGAAPSWFEVLGRDAALLAQAALARFPVDHVEEGGKVEELHRLARDNLARVEVDLWSTNASGFKGRAAIDRHLAALPLPEKKGASR